MPQKYSVTISGHRTSYSVEPEFHAELSHIAMENGISLAAQISRIDARRPPEQNLSSAIRLFVLERLKANSAARAIHD